MTGDGSEKWFNGNVYASFVELMGLEKLDETTFRSRFPAYSPGNSTRAYGGHVFAQAALAASRTLKPGFAIHSITGWFLLQGVTHHPFVYNVRTIREGTGYCQRQVDVHQREKDGVCFTCICSFKKPEPNVNARQHHINIREKYRNVLGDKSPDDFPECPTVDSPFFWNVEKKYGKDPFPGLKMTKVDMAAYNGPRSTVERRQLHFYKILGDIPSVQEDHNLHAAAHLYASDRNGLFPIPNHLGVGDDYSAIASLSHTVIFHVEAEELSMVDENGRPIWFCQELEVNRIAHGRGLVTSRAWRDDGLHVFTHFQDGQLRMKPNDGKRKNAEDIFNGNAPKPAKGKL